MGEIGSLRAAAFAAEWGVKRHALIATAAMERLQSAAAKQEIQRILKGNDASLGEAAQWADRIKEKNKPNDPPTKRFLGDPRNSTHRTWHYVNLPLGLDGYDRERYPEFTRSDDVVQILLLCVESLRDPGSHARFEEITALRWLSHLTGDLHQPVHVGCGYIADAKTKKARLVFAPEEALKLPSDKGGGQLVLPTGPNLHSFWDSQLGPDLVPNALDASSNDMLVRELVHAQPAAASFDKDADTAGQVVGWANASLEAARSAYQGIRITGFKPSAEGDYPVDWEGASDYRKRCAPIVSERMASAAANLAALLDSIWT